MKIEFTEWKEGQLVITSDIVQDAKRAFEQNEWFGAYARIHVMIEFWMQQIYELDYSQKNKMHELVEKLNKNYFYGYGQLIRDTTRMGYITEGESQRLSEWGKLRNRIFHRLIKYSYQTAHYNVVKKEEVIRGFDEGLALEELVRERVQQIVSKVLGRMIVNPQPSPST